MTRERRAVAAVPNTLEDANNRCHCVPTLLNLVILCVQRPFLPANFNNDPQSKPSGTVVAVHIPPEGAIDGCYWVPTLLNLTCPFPPADFENDPRLEPSGTVVAVRIPSHQKMPLMGIVACQPCSV